MNKKINDLKEILQKIDIKNFNLSIIEKNIETLIKIFDKLKLIDSQLSFSKSNMIYSKISKNDEENKILSSYLYKYISMIDSIKLSETIAKLNNKIFIQVENIVFFYISEDDTQMEKDLEQIYQMIRITLILNKFVFTDDKTIRHVVWIPIDTFRDFEYEFINEDNLKKSNEEYKAFTVSGVTSGLNPRLTLITRYEEVVKLLLHELIHNFNIDGANFHTELKPIIKKFTKIKSTSKSISKSNYNYEYSIYESYTELLGTYLYFLFQNLKSDQLELENTLIGLIGSEILYSYNLIVNLAHLNKYESYEEFIGSQIFIGNICIYEYYYVKGLLYNNFELVLPSSSDEFINMYKQINSIIKKAPSDNLLKEIFSLSKSQTNYKYILN